MGGDVDVDEALAEGEPVEAPDRRGPAAQARRREARIAAAGRAACGRRGSAAQRPAPPAQPPTPPARREVRQVGAVGPDRAPAQAALDTEVGRGSPRSARSSGRRGRTRRRVGPGSVRGRRPAAPRLGSVEQLARRGERAPAAARAAAEHLAASSTIRPSRSSRSTSVTVRPSRSRLAIRKWASAWAAIWGRCVTHRTWWSAREAHRLRPTGSALRPPIPVSTSSNTSVGVSSASARTSLDRERDPGQLAARGDPRQRPRRLARVRARAGRRPGRCPVHRTRPHRRRSRPPARRGRPGRRPEADLERPRPGSRAPQDRADGLAEGPAGRARARVDRRGRRVRDRARAAGRRPPRRAARSSSSPRSRSASARARSPWAMTAASSSPKRRRARGCRQPLVERRRARAGSWSIVSASPRTSRRRRRAPPRARRAGRRGVEARIEPGQRAGLPYRDRDGVARAAALGRQRLDAGRAPRAMASPCCAAVEPGPDLVRLARAGAAPPRSRSPRARASSSRRASSRGSSSSSAEGGPVLPPALDRIGHRRSRSSACPPNASSRSRCQRSSRSRCWSCWPWISTSGADLLGEPRAVTGSSSSGRSNGPRRRPRERR